MHTNRNGILLATAAILLGGCASKERHSFATPEEAVRALSAAGEDEELAEALLGAGGFDLLRSGDEVADREDLEAVRRLIDEKVVIEELGDGVTVALLGAEGWEFPIPLQQKGAHWSFDVEAGREEVLARRIGRNELSTIATLRALVEAQREYAAVGRDGHPRAYANRFWSSEGKRDGLYWSVAEGEEPSPMGPLVADAADEGYARGEDGPKPYHGYHYRLLREQGGHAPGGARSYVDAEGLLSGGFAVLAWPASYDNSGVMSFLVSHQGLVYQQDLGPSTAERARAIQAYDPDASWEPSID